MSGVLQWQARTPPFVSRAEAFGRPAFDVTEPAAFQGPGEVHHAPLLANCFHCSFSTSVDLYTRTFEHFGIALIVALT